MKLTILGSGTCVPSLERSASVYFLNIGDLNILVDCGPGTLRQLLKADISYKEVDIVFFTHFHPDHISELEPFLQALNYTPGFDRKKNLTLIGPEGFKDFCSQKIKTKTRPDTFNIELKETQDGVQFNEFQVTYTNTIHSPESIAYRFTQGDKSIIITGDCDYDEKLIEFSKEADVLLIECSFSNDMKVVGHLVSKECGEIGKRANVGQLILTHLYPLQKELRLEETKEIFPKTILAEDLLEITL